MPSRTYSALGLGWATWIDLDGDDKGPVILTSNKNGTPPAYLERAADAERIFGVKRGAAIDNQPGNEQARSFVQEFPADALARIKIESSQFYAEQFEDAADKPTARIKSDGDGEGEATAKPARKTGTRKTG